MEVVSDVGMSVRDGGASNQGNGVASSEGDVDVAGGGARWRECCRFPFSESSWKTSLTMSHPCSISVIKMVEVLTDQVQGGVWRK